jgi:hypothetical protein
MDMARLLLQRVEVEGAQQDGLLRECLERSVVRRASHRTTVRCRQLSATFTALSGSSLPKERW